MKEADLPPVLAAFASGSGTSDSSPMGRFSPVGMDLCGSLHTLNPGPMAQDRVKLRPPSVAAAVETDELISPDFLEKAYPVCSLFGCLHSL